MFWRSHVRTAAIAALAVVTLAACGSDDGGDDAAPSEGTDTTEATAGGFEDVVAAAEEEDTLVVYMSNAPDPLNALAEAFREKYPDVEVEMVRLPDADVVTTVDTEVSTGQRKASFVGNTAVTWIEGRAAEGWFAEPIGPNFSEDEGYDADSYVHDGGYFEQGASVLTFAWNSDLVPDGLDDYTDLLDPELAGGQVGVIDIAIGPAQADYYKWIEDRFGAEYLEDLAAQEPRIYPSALPINEALISGEIAAAVYASPFGLADAAAKGAPVDFAVSPKGAWGAKQYGMILDGAPSPNAAQLFADFVISTEGQAILTAVSGSVRADVPDALALNVDIADQDRELQEPQNLQPYVASWNSLFR